MSVVKSVHSCILQAPITQLPSNSNYLSSFQTCEETLFYLTASVETTLSPFTGTGCYQSCKHLMSTSYIKFLSLLNLKNGSFVADGEQFFLG